MRLVPSRPQRVQMGIHPLSLWEEDSWENTKNTSGRSCLVPRPPPSGKRSPRQQQCKMFELETLNVSLIESDHAFATLSDQNGHLAGLSDPFKKEKLFAVDE